MKKLSFLKCFVKTLPAASESLVKTLRATSLLGMMLLAPMGATAQVTIGSGDLPQATLDIVGTNKPGNAFRLDDGTQAPGNVLTCGANGIGTWQPVGVLTRHGTIAIHNNVVLNMSDYTLSANQWYVDTNSYIELEAGTWLIIYNIPYSYNFNCSTNDWVRTQLSLVKEGTTTATAVVGQWINAPFLSSYIIRTPLMVTTTTSGATAKYYLAFGTFSSSTPALLNNSTTLLPNSAGVAGITAILLSN